MQDEDLPYGIDFDGVLAKSIWPHRGIGLPIIRNHDKLREVAEAGYKVVIHTARPWSDYEMIVSWLDKFDLPYTAVVCGKFLAYKYVDDKAINSEEVTWLR